MMNFTYNIITIRGTESAIKQFQNTPSLNLKPPTDLKQVRIDRENGRHLPYVFDPSQVIVLARATDIGIKQLKKAGLHVDVEKTPKQVENSVAFGYLTSSQIFNRIDSMISNQQNYPNSNLVISKQTLKHKSSGGPDKTKEPEKDIYGFKIETGNPNAIQVLIITGIHGRELAPPDALLSFFEKMIDAYNNKTPYCHKGFVMKKPDKDKLNDGGYKRKITFEDAMFSAGKVAKIFYELEIHVIPVVNPDSRDFALELPTNRMWRTNRRPLSNNCIVGPDPIGVDINRNFPIAWNIEEYYKDSVVNEIKSHTKSRIGMTVTDPCDAQDIFGIDFQNFPRLGFDSAGRYGTFESRDIYCGPSEKSELETLNIIDYVNKLQNLRFFLDIHQAGREIWIPWHFNKNQNPDGTMDPSQTYLNPDWNKKQGIPSSGRPYQDPTVYQEFFPEKDNFHLEVKLTKLAAMMSDFILKAAGGDDHARNRSEYKIVDDAIGYKGAPGSASDYVFSTQLRADKDNYAEVIPEKFPIFSLHLEAGHLSDGYHQPQINKPNNQFKKVEREIHFALLGFLFYAASKEHFKTINLPKDL